MQTKTAELTRACLLSTAGLPAPLSSADAETVALAQWLAARILDDADAFQALENGIHIVDYRLRTSHYPMKSAKIPGFSGAVTLESHLPAPLEEVWKLLALFAPYCGIGIKTTLGMGGVSLRSNSGSAAYR